MRIDFCGYSYHNHLFHTLHQSRYSSYLFRLQVEGQAAININEETHPIEKGDLLIVKPGEGYELHVSDGQQSGDFHLYCEGNEISERFRHSPTLSKIALDDGILNLWQYLIIEERRPEMERNRELTYHLLSALFVSLERALDKKSTDTFRPYIVTRMMRYIEENATKQGFKIESIAAFCNLSESRCVHLFKEYVGQTIIEYAQSIRLSTAINQMKYTTMTLENIAQNCGFGSYSYFHRVFKKTYLVSPREYRQKIFDF
ncbi:helix-turn-helix transcriptional regulator [Gracilibacillus alcaliphilus]|uniref:helix-turn-helix transcriptional regulator n=1 Tax=Gracilibacillus alcaliphilus TaxID=1401441 RepID=UPI0019567878|nr:AraC family transcriptional regulator [Gracilibacillus alcaliphilus]MBM7676374.1 AraC family transcriptional regulator of arabinose operon [Gracilibacillus alcaliphilus]